MAIMNDFKIYEKSLDSEFCDGLVNKIDLFNDKCETQIEILDCG